MIFAADLLRKCECLLEQRNGLVQLTRVPDRRPPRLSMDCQCLGVLGPRFVLLELQGFFKQSHGFVERARIKCRPLPDHAMLASVSGWSDPSVSLRSRSVSSNNRRASSNRPASP